MWRKETLAFKYQQSRGDGENEKTIHVLEKLSQELDHIR